MVRKDVMHKISPQMMKWLFLSACIFMIDFLSKQFIIKHFSHIIPYRITDMLNIVVTYNSGIAFSLLSHFNAKGMLVISGVGMLIVVGLFFWLSRLAAQDKMLAIGISLIIGGALGNLCDRLILGYVIDFIDLHYRQYHWPVFNIADSAITLGVFLLGIHVAKKKK